jgi:uncharacterized membrane protein HdeD (DUF308 family)
VSPSQASANSNVSAALTKSMLDHWGLYLGEVIVLVLLGLAAIIFPFIAGIVVTVFLGWLFLIAGIVGLVSTTSVASCQQSTCTRRRPSCLCATARKPWRVSGNC